VLADDLFAQALALLTCPTMLILGEDDNMIPPTFPASLATLCLHQSEGHSFPGCGHAFAHRCFAFKCTAQPILSMPRQVSPNIYSVDTDRRKCLFVCFLSVCMYTYMYVYIFLSLLSFFFLSLSTATIGS
jgi:fermentation-respiration switch protein FrsA (DUF1100 family)